MTNAERLRTALETADPVRKLRAVISELATEGCTKQEITMLLETLLLNLRDRPDHREVDEDAILDLLDGLAGWCQAEARILPEKTTKLSSIHDN